MRNILTVGDAIILIKHRGYKKKILNVVLKSKLLQNWYFESIYKFTYEILDNPQQMEKLKVDFLKTKGIGKNTIMFFLDHCLEIKRSSDEEISYKICAMCKGKGYYLSLLHKKIEWERLLLDDETTKESLVCTKKIYSKKKCSKCKCRSKFSWEKS